MSGDTPQYSDDQEVADAIREAELRLWWARQGPEAQEQIKRVMSGEEDDPVFTAMMEKTIADIKARRKA